jgi:hypothetical protein
VCVVRRTLLAVTSNGIHADIALGAMPFEERAVDRSSPFSISNTETLTTCSAEDLVVHKAFAGRDKDWLDIRGIVIRQGAKFDQALVWNELLPLLELRDDRTTEEQLRAVFNSQSRERDCGDPLYE